MKMLNFKIKQVENINKIKLNKRFTQNMQTTVDLVWNLMKSNVNVVLRWYGNSDGWNKESKIKGLVKI